jgi:hypothetical protein
VVCCDGVVRCDVYRVVECAVWCGGILPTAGIGSFGQLKSAQLEESKKEKS